AGGSSVVTTQINQTCFANLSPFFEYAPRRAMDNAYPNPHKRLASKLQQQCESRHRIEIGDGFLRTYLLARVSCNLLRKRGSRRKFRRKIRSAAWLFAILVET